jgi:opacity protein-like surface antigen
MRAVVMAVAMTIAGAGSLAAQTDRGYVTGFGGVSRTEDATTGDYLGEAGVRVAPHLMVFGDVGRFQNLQPSAVQPAVDNTTTLLSSEGVSVTSRTRVPAWYSIAGLRYDAPGANRVSPYVLGGIGLARLTPSVQFAFASGTLPDGSTPTAGADITSQLVTAGDFTSPASSNALMMTLGGGVDVPMTRRWAVNAGYRFSRVQAGTPLNANGMTFGFGYRF